MREEQCVETQLTWSLVDVAQTGCFPSPIVDDPKPSIGSTIRTVDETKGSYAARSRCRHMLLKRCWRDPPGLLNHKIPVDDRTRLVEPRVTACIVTKRYENLRVF